MNDTVYIVTLHDHIEGVYAHRVDAQRALLTVDHRLLERQLLTKAPQPYKEALLRLANKLEGTGPYSEIGPVPSKQFDMNVWSCGTAACAGGHACSDQWFIDRGLSLKGLDVLTGPSLIPHYRGVEGFDALALFFNITVDDAIAIFNLSAYRDDGKHIIRCIIERLREYAE
jgi:hypothetical protein